MKLKGMKTMREVVAEALWRNNRLDGREETYPYERLIEPTKADLLRLADAALVALGLDDWDAAVLRAADALDVFEENLGRGWHRARAIAALEAALTCFATEGADDGNR
jgi:hypothetical protein